MRAYVCVSAAPKCTTACTPQPYRTDRNDGRCHNRLIRALIRTYLLARIYSYNRRDIQVGLVRQDEESCFVPSQKKREWGQLQQKEAFTSQDENLQLAAGWTGKSLGKVIAVFVRKD